jgi:hypothetical protein
MVHICDGPKEQRFLLQVKNSHETKELRMNGPGFHVCKMLLIDLLLITSMSNIRRDHLSIAVLRGVLFNVCHKQEVSLTVHALVGLEIQLMM